MFSRILTKLIDEAILPAVCVVAAKIIGTAFAIHYFQIKLADNTNLINVYIPNKESFLLVNSYSMLFMYVVIFIGAFFFLVKSRWFHETHISPNFAVKIFSFRLGNFIKSSMDVYSEGTIWLSYSYLLTLILGMQLYFGVVYSWIFVISLVLSLLLTLVFVSDVERELDLEK